MAAVGERMTAGELMEWNAYEQTYGSLLIHERIDSGFAMVAMILAKAFSSNGSRYQMRDFMPRWYQELTKDAELEKGISQLRMLVDDGGAPSQQ